VTETAGFHRTSGFIDDTRAFCSIPARHDMSRRVDAGYLASLVATHQLTEDDAFAVARRLVDDIPRATFRLG
jgi:glucuronate isomerase